MKAPEIDRASLLPRVKGSCRGMNPTGHRSGAGPAIPLWFPRQKQEKKSYENK